MEDPSPGQECQQSHNQGDSSDDWEQEFSCRALGPGLNRRDAARADVSGGGRLESWDGGAAGTGVAFEALKIGAHFRGALATQVGFFFESFVDELFELGGQVRI